LVVDKVKPDITILAGDLSWDGFTPFYYSDKGIKSESTQKRIHAERFYSFLKHAGKKAPVLVVKGNHDEEGDYSRERIDGIARCREISGKFVEVEGLRFLGFGFNDAHSVKVIRSMVSEFSGKVDVVVMHGENIRLISSLKPGIIVKGGGVFGKFLVNDVASVYIGPDVYAVIDLREKTADHIYLFNFKGKSITKFIPLYRRYKWIKPYPTLNQYFIGKNCQS